MKLYNATLAVVIAFILSSCSLIRPEPPEINLMNLTISEVTLSHLNLIADLRIFNPNSISIDVKEVEYSLSINGTKISEGRNPKGVRVGPSEYENLNIRISTAYWEIARIVNSLQAGKEVNFVLSGLVKVGGLGVIGKTFPFERKGVIPIKGGT